MSEENQTMDIETKASIHFVLFSIALFFNTIAFVLLLYVAVFFDQIYNQILKAIVPVLLLGFDNYVFVIGSLGVQIILFIAYIPLLVFDAYYLYYLFKRLLFREILWKEETEETEK